MFLVVEALCGYEVEEELYELAVLEGLDDCLGARH